MSPKRTSEPDPTIASRFLAHQLSDAERVVLEAELMVNPAAVQELEATARMKIGLHRLRETGELNALLAPPVRRSKGPTIVALAACLAALSLLLGRMVIPPAPQLLTVFQEPRGAEAAIDASQPSYLVLRPRSAVDQTVIERTRTRGAIKLSILPATELAPPLRVSLLNEDGSKTLGQVTVPAADSKKQVSVLADSVQLNPGSYLLALTSLGEPSQPEERFLLKVLEAAAPQPQSGAAGSGRTRHERLKVSRAVSAHHRQRR